MGTERKYLVIISLQMLKRTAGEVLICHSQLRSDNHTESVVENQSKLRVVETTVGGTF